MKTNLKERIKELIAKGVSIPAPFTVDIGEEVKPDRISTKGVVIHPGTRIYGEKTLISDHVILGREAPITIENCRIGPAAELRGGYFRESTFLEGVCLGSGAQIREGCLLEEQATAGHTVGLKQTVLFPFVTLGSLINFCDCFMAGGTSRKNHSEVGSSYIHFNFTPQQDKATPSLLGNVPHGVMLGESPIFLGGQGGIIGPARIGFGTVAAAGTILRRDCEEGGKIISSGIGTYEKDFIPGCYGDISRRVLNNIIYTANILALREWYRHVRQPVFRARHMGDLWAGAMDTIDCVLHERINRFRDFAQKMDDSVLKSRLDQRRQIQFHERWPDMEAVFTGGEEKFLGAKQRESFLKALGIMTKKDMPDYISLIQGLDKKTAAVGTAWLDAIVSGITDNAGGYVPLCKPSRS